jgi:hypothetical protein
MHRLLALSLLATAAVGGMSGAAHADPCFGSANVGVVCYRNVVVYDDCIYAGGGPCTPVTVTGPACYYGGGRDWELVPSPFC